MKAKKISKTTIILYIAPESFFEPTASSCSSAKRRLEGLALDFCPKQFKSGSEDVSMLYPGESFCLIREDEINRRLKKTELLLNGGKLRYQGQRLGIKELEKLYNSKKEKGFKLAENFLNFFYPELELASYFREYSQDGFVRASELKSLRGLYGVPLSDVIKAALVDIKGYYSKHLLAHGRLQQTNKPFYHIQSIKTGGAKEEAYLILTCLHSRRLYFDSDKLAKEIKKKINRKGKDAILAKYFVQQHKTKIIRNPKRLIVDYGYVTETIYNMPQDIWRRNSFV